jgi:hypothetical protein
VDEEASMADKAAERTITRAQFRFSKALTEILVYIVVLNLFVEYVDTVIIASFTISILTAVLLWLMLGAIAGIEHRVAGYFRRRKGVVPRILRYLSAWAILFVSKFVILEVVAFASRGQAALGHFVEIVAIVLALMGAEYLLRRAYRALGSPAAREGEPDS